MGQAGIRVKIGAQTDQRDLNRVEMQFNKMMNRMSGKQVAFNINGRSFTQPLGRITAQANEFTKSLEASNARVIAFGASVGIINAVSDAFKGLVAETVRFEKTLADINVILNSSNQGLQSFGDSLFRVAKNTAQSFNVVATAALEFSRQGLSMEETLKRTNDALILTRLTSLKAEEAVAGLTAAVNAFASTGLTTTNIIDKLAAVDVRFAVSSEDLIHALERTGAVAIDAGVELNDLIGLVTALQQTTARGGAVIGNGLKTIFTRIQRPESIRQIEELGVSVRNLTGAVLPADKILLNMAKSFKTLTQAQQSNVVQFSAGIFQANVFRAALRDLAKDSSLYAQASQVAGDAAGEAALKNDKLNKTLSALASQSSTAIRELAGVMGDLMLKPELGGFMEAFLSTVEGLKNALGGGEDEGSDFAQGFVRGIGNVLTGPGLLAFGAVFVKMLLNVGKFASQSIKDVLGIVDKKEKLKQMEEAIVGVLAQNKHIQEGLNELEGDRAAQEKFILKIIEAQTNAMVKQKQIAGSLAGPLLRSGVSTDLTVNSNDFVDLDGDSKIDSFGARGVIPRHTANREKQGAMRAGYQPGPVDSMEVKGMGTVVYNKAETIKKFPGMDQPAIMPPKASRAGQSYKKDFNKQHGFNPYNELPSQKYDGYIPNYANTTLKNNVTKNKERMHLRGTPFQDFPNYIKDQIKRPDGSLGGGDLKFKTLSSSLKTNTFRNIGSYLEALGVYDIETTIPFDFIDLPVGKKGRMTPTTKAGLTQGTPKQRGDFAESKFLESDAGLGYLSTALDDQGVVDAVSKEGAPTEVKAAGISLQNIFEKSIRRYSNQKFRDTLESVASYHRDPTRYENPNTQIEGFSTNGEIADALSQSIIGIEEDSIVKNLSTLARMGEYTIPGMTKEQLKSSIQGQNFRKDLMARGIGQGEKDKLMEFGMSSGLVPNFVDLTKAGLISGGTEYSLTSGEYPGYYFKPTPGQAVPAKDTSMIKGKAREAMGGTLARKLSIQYNTLKAAQKISYPAVDTGNGRTFEDKVGGAIYAGETPKWSDNFDFRLSPISPPRGGGPPYYNYLISDQTGYSDPHSGFGHTPHQLIKKFSNDGKLNDISFIESDKKSTNKKTGKPTGGTIRGYLPEKFVEFVGKGSDDAMARSGSIDGGRSVTLGAKNVNQPTKDMLMQHPDVAALYNQAPKGWHQNLELFGKKDQLQFANGLVPNFQKQYQRQILTDDETGTFLKYSSGSPGYANIETAHMGESGKRGGHHRNFTKLMEQYESVGSGFLSPQRAGYGPTSWAKLITMFPQIKNRIQPGLRTRGDFSIDGSEMGFRSLVGLKKMTKAWFNQYPDDINFLENFGRNEFFDESVSFENLTTSRVKGKADGEAGFMNKGLVPNFLSWRDRPGGGSKIPSPDSPGLYSKEEVEELKGMGYKRTDSHGWHFAEPTGLKHTPPTTSSPFGQAGPVSFDFLSRMIQHDREMYSIPNRRGDNANLDELGQSLIKGQKDSAIIGYDSSVNRMQLIEGNHRVAALARLNKDRDKTQKFYTGMHAYVTGVKLRDQSQMDHAAGFVNQQIYPPKIPDDIIEAKKDPYRAPGQFVQGSWSPDDFGIPNFNVDLSNGYHDRKSIGSAISKVYKSKTGKKMGRQDVDFSIERYISAMKDKQIDDGDNFTSNYPGGHFSVGGQKFNFNEISMALLKHGQFVGEKSNGLVPNFENVNLKRGQTDPNAPLMEPNINPVLYEPILAASTPEDVYNKLSSFMQAHATGRLSGRSSMGTSGGIGKKIEDYITKSFIRSDGTYKTWEESDDPYSETWMNEDLGTTVDPSGFLDIASGAVSYTTRDAIADQFHKSKKDGGKSKGKIHEVTVPRKNIFGKKKLLRMLSMGAKPPSYPMVDKLKGSIRDGSFFDYWRNKGGLFMNIDGERNDRSLINLDKELNGLRPELGKGEIRTSMFTRRMPSIAPHVDRESGQFYNEQEVTRIVNHGLVPNFSEVDRVRGAQKRRVGGQREYATSDVRASDSDSAQKIYDYLLLNVGGLSSGFGYDKQTLGFRGSSEDFASVMRASRSSRNRSNLSELAGGEFNLDRILGGIMANHTEAVLSARGKLKKHEDPFMSGAMFRGVIPNFSNPLMDAVNREKAAGIPSHRIKIEKSSQLKSSRNPAGLAVTNTRDEPGGVAQGIRRARMMKIDPRKHGAAKGFTPNFNDYQAPLPAPPKPVSSAPTAPAPTAPTGTGNSELDAKNKELGEGLEKEGKEMLQSMKGLASTYDSQSEQGEKINKKLKALESALTNAGENFEKTGDAQSFTKSTDLETAKSELEGAALTAASSKSDPARAAAGKKAVDQMIAFNGKVQGATSALSDLEKGNGASLQKLFYMQSAISMANGALQQMAENGSAASKSIANFGMGLSNTAAAFMQAKEMGGMLSQMVGTRDEQGKSDGTEIKFQNLFGEGKKKRLEATDIANRKAALTQSKKAPGFFGKLGGGKLGGVTKLFGTLSKLGGRLIPVVGQIYSFGTAVNEAFKVLTSFSHIADIFGVEQGEGIMALMEGASAKAAKRIEKLGVVAEATSSALEAVEQNAKIQDELAELEIKGSKRSRAENSKFHELTMKGIDAKGKETEALAKLTDESVVGKVGMELYNTHMSKATNTTEGTIVALRELEMATKLLTLQTKQVELFEKALNRAGEKGDLFGNDSEFQKKAAENQGVQMAKLFDSQLTKRNKDGSVNIEETKENMDLLENFNAHEFRGGTDQNDIEFDNFVKKLNLNNDMDAANIAGTLHDFFQVIEDEDFLDSSKNGDENKQIQAMVRKIGDQLRRTGSASAGNELFMEDAIHKKILKRLVSAETKRLDLLMMDIKHGHTMASIGRDMINKQRATADAMGLVAKETIVQAERSRRNNELDEKQNQARRAAQDAFNKKMLKSMPKIMDTGNLGDGISVTGTVEDLMVSQEEFNKRIRNTIDKVKNAGNMETALMGINKNMPDELKVSATDGQREQVQKLLSGIQVEPGDKGIKGSMQVQLNEIAKRLKDVKLDPLVKAMVMAALGMENVINLEHDMESELAEAVTTLSKTKKEQDNLLIQEKNKNKLALQELNITEQTIEGAVIVKNRLEKHGQILEAIKINLMGQAAHLRVANDAVREQSDIEAKSVGLRAKIFEELRKKAREGASADRESFLSEQGNNSILGASSGTLDERQKEVQKNLLKSQLFKFGSEIKSAESAAKTAELKAKFFQIESNMFRLASEKLNAEVEGLKFTTHEAAKRSLILDNTGQRERIALLQLNQEIIASTETKKAADIRKRLLETGNKRYMLALNSHDTEMSELEASIEGTKDKLAISVLRGDIMKTAGLQLEEELASLQKSSLISAANELILSGKNEMSDKMKRANELQDMSNRMQEMRIAKDKAFISQETLNRNTEVGIVTEKMGAFGEMRTAGTKASMTGNADDLQAAAQAQLIYNRSINGTTGALDQVVLEMANMAVSASNLKSDLVSIGFDSARSELKTVFNTIADGSKSIGDAFLDMAHGVGKAISDRLMDHSIDQIISNLSFAITGKKPEDEAERMKNAIKNAHEYHVGELKGQAEKASELMGAAMKAAISEVTKDIVIGVPSLDELEKQLANFSNVISVGFENGGASFRKIIQDTLGDKSIWDTLLKSNNIALLNNKDATEKLTTAIEGKASELASKEATEEAVIARAAAKAKAKEAIPPPVPAFPPQAEKSFDHASFASVAEKKISGFKDMLKFGDNAYDVTMSGVTKKGTRNKDLVDQQQLKRRIGTLKELGVYRDGKYFETGGNRVKLREKSERIGKSGLHDVGVKESQLATNITSGYNANDKIMETARAILVYKEAVKKTTELEAEGGAKAAQSLKDLEIASKKLAKMLDMAATTPTPTIKPITEYEGGKIQKYHQGGLVKNFGKGGEVPALLEAGEYVIPKDTVSRYNKGGRTKAGERTRAGVDGIAGLAGGVAGSYLVDKWMGGDENQEDGRPTFDMKRFNTLGLDSDVNMNSNDRRLSSRFQAGNKVSQDYKSYLKDLSDYDTDKTNQKFSEKMGKLQGYLGTFVGMAAGAATQGIALGAQALKTGTQNFVQGKMGLGKKENVAAYQQLKAAEKNVNYSEVARFNKSQLAKGVDVSEIDYSSFDEVKGGSNFGAFLNPKDAFRSSKDRTGTFGANKAARPSGDSGSFFDGFFGRKSKEQKIKDKAGKQKLIDFYKSKGEFKDKGGFGYNSGGQVPAMLTKGETVIPGNVASRIGYENLNQMNTTGDFPIVQGKGGIDNVGPVSLNSGDFVLRKSSTEKLSRNNPNMMRFASQNPEGFRRASKGYYDGGIVDQGLTYPSTSMAVGGSGGTRQSPGLSPQPDSVDAGLGSSSSKGAVTNNINVNVTIDKSGGESSSSSNDTQGSESSYAKEKELSSKIKAAVLDVIKQEKRVGGELS